MVSYTHHDAGPRDELGLTLRLLMGVTREGMAYGV